MSLLRSYSPLSGVLYKYSTPTEFASDLALASTEVVAAMTGALEAD